MKRLAQILVLGTLGVMAMADSASASLGGCRDMCIWSTGYCGGEGGMWVQNCNNTGAYYRAQNDVCDLDAYCWYWPMVY